MANRGFSTPESTRAFLEPQFYNPCPATELPGLSKTVERLISAIKNSEPICVWGDFDVDGQTSTTILVQTLQMLGAKVNYHIPIRQRESHGVNIENLEHVISRGARLVLTCDTGIGAVEAAAYAREQGVDFLISDHHDLPAELPDAFSIVNPKLLADDHPLSNLAGVGVAYKIAEELIEQLKPANLKPEDLLDLAALGLVADLAILRADTRYLVQKGLQQLRQTKRLGLKTLMELAELSQLQLTEEHIGFMIAPRMNAIGRLGDANPVVDLLTTTNPVRARVLASQLEGLNVERKLLCDQVFQAAEAQLKEHPDLLEYAVIILSHPRWPGGIVGIVASKMVERYHKPAILLVAPAGGTARGSARSIEGLNITAAITAHKELLLGFGGHPMAAGLAIETEKIPEFRRKISRTIEAMMGNRLQTEGKLEIDDWLELGQADLDLAHQLEKLAPFGPGNPKLILASRNLTLTSSTKLGKNKEHLKLTVSDEHGDSRQIMWWDGGNESPPSGLFDLAYTLRASDWRGTPQAQLEYVDLRVLEPDLLLITKPKIQILDQRGIENPEKVLKKLMAEADILCWAEGDDKKRLNGSDRTMLVPAKTLVIWSTPPSRQELLNAMEKVNPENVIIFGIDPGTDEIKPFLDRLAGLIKFVIGKREGKTSITELAAATAQKVSTVRLGLDYLLHKRLFSIKDQRDEQLTMNTNDQASMESNAETQRLSEKTTRQLRDILEETQAFRKNFREQQEINLD